MSQLHQHLTTEYLHFPWRLSWNEQMNHVLLAIDFHFTINDIDHQERHFQETFQFLFLGHTSIPIGSQSFVKVFMIDESQGIKEGELLAFSKYVKLLMQDAKAQCVQQSEKNLYLPLDLHWSEETYHHYRQSLINTHRYNERQLYFP